MKDQEGINMDLIHRVEKLRNEKAKREEEHAQKIKEVIVELKSSFVEAFWEAKINLVEDVVNT